MPTPRRNVAEAYPLPRLPPQARLIVHDVLADDHRDYEPVAQLVEGVDDRGGVHVEFVGGVAVVTTQRSWASYPIRHTPARLFGLAPEEIGRYRANSRFRGHGCCATEWHYEAWTGTPMPVSVHSIGGEPSAWLACRGWRRTAS